MSMLFLPYFDNFFFSDKTDAACKAHDASWNRGVSLRVTQPARSEPDKVVLDWNSAIHNSRCVDFYNVYGKSISEILEPLGEICIVGSTVFSSGSIIQTRFKITNSLSQAFSR